MPPELRKAHQQNDKAVMQAYGFWGKLNTETECKRQIYLHMGRAADGDPTAAQEIFSFCPALTWSIPGEQALDYFRLRQFCC